MDRHSGLTDRFEENRPRLRGVALTFIFTNARIARLEVIGDPSRLRELEISVL